MIGVIDVGGGLRGSYGAGVLDACLRKGVHFDYGAGVSAGSANILSYLAGQMGRNYTFYTEYTFRKEYMSLAIFLRTKDYLGLDYIYGTLSDDGGEYPIDYDGIMNNPADFAVVATDALTGKPMYYDKKDYQRNDLGFLKGSCCVPVADQPYPYRDHLLFDGALSDPIPYEHCFEAGCDKIVVILTRPRDEVRSNESDLRLAKLLEHKYPVAAENMRNRIPLYQKKLQECFALEKDGKVLIVAPDSIGQMKTLTKDKAAIKDLYVKGFHDADSIWDFVG